MYPKIVPCDPTKSHHSLIKNPDNENYSKSNEAEFDRLEKLRKSAELSRLRRNNETPEQRAKRLNDLKLRARKRREEVKQRESEEDRKSRLAKQAEYARIRRQRELKKTDNFAKIGDHSQSSILVSDKPSVLKILEPIIEMNT